MRYANYMKYKDIIREGDTVVCTFDEDALTEGKEYKVRGFYTDTDGDRDDFYYTVENDIGLKVEKFAWKFEYKPHNEITLEEELFTL